MTGRTADVTLQVGGLFDSKAATWPSRYVPDGVLRKKPAGHLSRAHEFLNLGPCIVNSPTEWPQSDSGA